MKCKSFLSSITHQYLTPILPKQSDRGFRVQELSHLLPARPPPPFNRQCQKFLTAVLLRPGRSSLAMAAGQESLQEVIMSFQPIGDTNQALGKHSLRRKSSCRCLHPFHQFCIKVRQAAYTAWQVLQVTCLMHSPRDSANILHLAL